jgi:splicing factor U2AF subunit
MRWENANGKGEFQHDWADHSFCNFMHLRHPTPSLVSSLNASQRLSRRKAAANGEVKVGEEMGWTPSAAKANGGGWQSNRSGGGDGAWRR